MRYEVWPMRRYTTYAPKELRESSDVHGEKSGEHVWERTLELGKWRQEHDVRLVWIYGCSPPRRDSALPTGAQGVRKDSNSLVGWLKTNKRWSPVSKSEMSHLPWFNGEEGIQKLREIRTLEQICHLRPAGRLQDTEISPPL